MMEKYIKLIQQRHHFLSLGQFSKAIKKTNQDKLKDQKDILKAKIRTFQNILHKFKEKKEPDAYFEAKESYDLIKETVLDILRTTSTILNEQALEALNKSSVKDLEFNYGVDNSVEELKMESEELQPLDGINDKLLHFFIVNYVPAVKVEKLQDDIHGLYSCVEDLQNILKLKKSIFQNKEEMLAKMIKSAIEELLCLEKSEKLLSTLLEEVLNDMNEFDPSKHFRLMEILEEALKYIYNKEMQSLDEEEFAVLKFTIIDFLFRLKDRHPYSNQEEKVMDILNRVMLFMSEKCFKPSKALIEEYEQSETTKCLNELPSFIHLKERIGMKREVYDRLKKRYQSKPTFIYYFDPKIDIQSTTGVDMGFKCLRIGFLKEGENNVIGAYLEIYEDGDLQQAYSKDNKREYFGRYFYSEGNFYIGGFKEGEYHGKGEIQWIDGRRMIGHWANGKKHGQFKLYNPDGTEEDKFYEEDELV